jgi:hypothetical protein
MLRIIDDFIIKIKSWAQGNERELFLGLLVVSVAALSYGLGRLSRIKESMPPVEITSSSSIRLVAAPGPENPRDGKIIASKKGTKYYLPWCGGGKAIKAANRISFDNEAAAIEAGYALAGNCSRTP